MNLTQKQWRQLLSTIKDLNDGLDEQALRERAGRKLIDLLSADYFASFVWDEAAGTFANPVFINMSADNLNRYLAYYQFHDPITRRLQAYRRAVSVNEVMDQQTLVRTEFFNDFLAKDGLYYGVNLYIYDRNQRNIGDFRIWRRRGKRNFGAEELGILDLVAPHFRNGMSNARKAKREWRFEAIRRHMASQCALTRRELDVAEALLKGRSNKQMSADLCISMPTLRTHVQHIYMKFGVHSRSEFCSKVIWEWRDGGQRRRFSDASSLPDFKR